MLSWRYGEHHPLIKCAIPNTHPDKSRLPLGPNWMPQVTADELHDARRFLRIASLLKVPQAIWLMRRKRLERVYKRPGIHHALVSSNL